VVGFSFQQLDQEDFMKYKTLFPRIITLAFIFLLFFAGCAESASTNEFPTGRFDYEAGSFAVRFNQDGTWIYYLVLNNNLTVTAEGTYQIDGNLLILANSPTSVARPNCEEPGEYTWTYDGTNLSFQVNGDDPCERRISAFDGHTFIKAEEEGEEQ
jgi:hypothetical protein